MATVSEIITRHKLTTMRETWEKDNRYTWHVLHKELDYMPVINKRIGDFRSEISVTGEKNSQFIGFILDRYEDNADMTKKNLRVHYQTAQGGGDSVPHNVEYTATHVRLAWLVPPQVTVSAGVVQMMIYATGTDGSKKQTVWKTLPCNYTVYEGLEIGENMPEPDRSWYEQFVAEMDAEVREAKEHADNAATNSAAAYTAAASSDRSAKQALRTLDDAKVYVESQKAAFVGYSKRETDTRYANALIGILSGAGSVVANDAWEAPIHSLDITGNSEQVRTTGANLLDMSKARGGTSSGITSTINSDGTVTSSGTSTDANINIWFRGGYNITPSADGSNVLLTLERGVTYTIQDVVLISRTTVINPGIYTCDVEGGFKVTGVRHAVVPVNTQPNERYYPVVAKSNKTVDWELYTGAKAAPRMDCPQKIYSTGTGGSFLNIVVAGLDKTQSQEIAIHLDAPLQGVGKVRDRITCKGGIWGVERWLGTIVFSGSPNERWTVNAKFSEGDYVASYLFITGRKLGKIACLSDRYTVVDTLTTNELRYQVAVSEFCHTEVPKTAMYMTIAKNRLITADKSGFTDYLGKNPVTFIYPLETPTWSPLSDIDQKNINSLSTHKGRTSVSITAPGARAGIEFGYVQDTNTVIKELSKLIAKNKRNRGQ